MKGAFIIHRSDDGGNTWCPVKPGDVPAWVKKPDVIGTLAAGRIAQYNGGLMIGDAATPWFRAERVVTEADQVSIEAAQAKRSRRNARNLRTVH